MNLSLRSAMRKLLIKAMLFCCAFSLHAEEIEVQLATRAALPAVYLQGFPEEILSLVQSDLQLGGLCTPTMKKEKARYCISSQQSPNMLHVSVYDTEKKITRDYKTLLDRKSLHRFSDALHRDLFGLLGVASQRILYTKRGKNPSKEGLDFLSEVWVCDADGQNAKQLTFDGSYCLSPSFIKGKDEFLFVSEKSGQSKIYRAALENPKPKLLLDMRGNQALACFSPGKSQIAFISDIAGRPDLFVQNLSESLKPLGKPRQLFSAPRATQASPTYSPDGAQVAFVSDKDGPPRIYLMRVSQGESGVRLITKRSRDNTAPAWSPDGSKLAYSAKTDGVRQIWIYDFAKAEETQLTFDPLNKENPAWAPDSFHLIYNTETESASDLFLVNLNGTAPILLQTGARFASWEMR